MLLDVLRQAHVPATFFLIGRDAEEWPELARRIESDGNEMGDHTYSHPNLDLESDDAVRSEILRGRDVLWKLTHDPAVRTLLRPPHGRYTERTLQIAQSLGYSVVLWTDDGGDWRTLTAARNRASMLAHATAPEIVLLHSGKLATIEAMPTVIEHFERAGYRFVTVERAARARAAPTNSTTRCAGRFKRPEVPRQIIDTESSRPAYLRRRIATLIVVARRVLVLALLGWLIWGHHGAARGRLGELGLPGNFLP